MSLTLHQYGDSAGHEAAPLEILDRHPRADPLSTVVAGRIHGGEQLLVPQHFARVEVAAAHRPPPGGHTGELEGRR